jgi:hypothetical protein
MNQKQTILLLHIAYWIGIIADAFISIIFLLPELAQFLLGVSDVSIGEEYLYVSRIAASLMLGWTFLLFWADRKPIERRDILILTIFPVVIGIMISGFFAVNNKFIPIQNIVPLWVFNIVLIIIYMISYLQSNKFAIKG